MILPSRSLALSLFAVLGLSGCINDKLNATRERVAFVSAIALSTGGDTYATRPLAAFYRANGVALNLGELETCVGLPYSALPPTVANLPTLSAGQYLYTEVGGRRDTLFPGTAVGLRSYQLLTVNAIPYIPGDTLKIEVPGDASGFPATTARVRTAEPFNFTVPTSTTEGEPMMLSWTPAPAPGSFMTVSMRLNNTGTGNTPDAQIYCRFNDDGTGQVDATLTAVWRASAPESRSVVFSRVRFTTVEIDSRTRLSLISYFDRPTSPVPVE
jgi:hypothetical protein